MKPKLFMWTVMLILLISISLCTQGQEDPYTSAMKSSIELMEQASDPGQLVDCSNQFERIAAAEKNKWMPYYYASYALISMSYDEDDLEKRDQILDRAQELLHKAMELEPEESELYTLQAFLYPSRILVDPMSRGMTYMKLMFASLENARKLNPENPRIYFLEGINKLNLPPSMGGGADIARPILEEALNKFEAFTKEDPLWPGWGEAATRVELAKLN